MENNKNDDLKRFKITPNDEREKEMTTKMTLPTGKYSRCKHWPAVIEAAKLQPHLSNLVLEHAATGHSGCLNAIMDNGDANLWLTYYTGRIVAPN